MCWPQAAGRRDARDVSKSAPPAVITSANFAVPRGRYDLVLEISVQNFTTKTTCGMTLRVRAETQAARVCHGVAGWLD